MKKIKVGLLPLYVKLYDDLNPGMHGRLDPFYDTIARLLEEKGLEVIRAPFCRLEEEFLRAVSLFENAEAECIVTLHMAYSPSLASEKALAQTKLPIVVMDTTETYTFSPEQTPAEIDYNHGIHGVMDMCNLLRRNRKLYAIAAGHYLHSDVVERTCGFVRAAAAARALSGSRVGVYGGSFDGMGDFQVTPEEMKTRFGVEMLEADDEEIKKISASVTEEEIDEELQKDQEQFDFPEELNEYRYRLNTRAGLTMRKWIEKEKLNAFSMNFMKINANTGLKSMPFLEACKAMTRGIGYAGEGDAMDAAMMGALYHAYENASFVEIFCPDWSGNRIMISHMGEMNYLLSDIRPQLRNASFNYTSAEAPVIGYARFRGGNAVYANICRDEDGYAMVLAPVEMMHVKEDHFPSSMRGWMKPAVSVAEFLEFLSRNGATHHSLLVYDARVEEMAYFGRLLGMKIIEL